MRIVFITHLYWYFLCCCFLKGLCLWSYLTGVLSNSNNLWTHLLEPLMEYYQLLRIWFRVDLGVITMKGYSTLPTSPELKLHYKMQFSHTHYTLFAGGSSYPSGGDTVGAFKDPRVILKIENVSCFFYTLVFLKSNKIF